MTKAGDKWVEPDHPGRSSFAMDFSDKTGEDRPGSQMERFVEELRRVANAYGFNIQTWGPTKKFVRSVAPAYMERVWVMREGEPNA